MQQQGAEITPDQERAQIEGAPGDHSAQQQYGPIPPELYRKWYEDMLLMRRFEEKAGQMYGQQKIRGFLHLYIGQEAIVAGSYSAIAPQDKVITAYRDHAHGLAAGITPNALMAELFGKATGSTKGKGGSMHLFTKEGGFFGGHGIVGAQIPLGAGIAFAEKYNNTGNICLTYMGDGAVRQGALHETFTMAMLWNLPVVFICENNRYGMGTAVERTTNVPELYRIGQAYDMPSFAVNGMDVEEVHWAVLAAADRARQGIPTFLELKTYRYKGHSMSDPAKYRSRDEVEEFKLNDPIQRLLEKMLQIGVADEDWAKEVDKNIKAVVEESVKFADESPFPDPSELYTDIYTQEDYPFLKDEY